MNEIVFFSLLAKLYRNEIDSLPEKIKINNKTYSKDISGNYYRVDKNESRMYLEEEYALDELINLPVVIIPKEEGRWKPKADEKYWFVDCAGKINYAWWDNDIIDDYRYQTNNCTETKEESVHHQENIKTEIKLRKLAEELNNGEKIDWENEDQRKHYLYYNYPIKAINQAFTTRTRIARQIYCLDKHFLKKAIKKIGKEKVADYLKET